MICVVCVCSWESVVSGEELAPSMSALRTLQQDFGSWQPRRGTILTFKAIFCGFCVTIVVFHWIILGQRCLKV